VSIPTTAELTQLTAPNQRVEAANGVTYAYRRFGNAERGAPPVLFFTHFRGNLDNWDPALVDAIAAQREVLLLDNAGVAGSSGTVPATFTAMARDALAFVDAVGIRTLDVLGYSIGGFVAQELTLIRPQLVRRLVLAGTGPQGGDRMHGWPAEVLAMAVADEQGAEHLLYLFFERSPESLARGGEFVERIFARTEDRDEPVSLSARDAQLDALTEWGIPCEQAQSARRHHAADAGGQRRQRHHGADAEQPGAGRAAPERPAIDLSQREPRFPVPVPGGVRRRGQPLPRLSSRPYRPSRHRRGKAQGVRSVPRAPIRAASSPNPVT